MAARFLRSERAEHRIAAARRFLAGLPPGEPFVVVGGRRHAADRLCHDLAEAQGALFGAFRYGFFALAEHLAAPELAARALRPLTPAAALATVVRVVHHARRDGNLRRFGPISEGPGLAARLARTFSELRLAGITADRLAEADPDLGALYAAHLDELRGAQIADTATVFGAATSRIENGKAPLPVGLPTLFLDVPLTDRSATRFASALVAAAPEALLTLPTGDTATENALQDFSPVPVEASVEHTGNSGEPDAVAAAQQNLFGSHRPAPTDGGGLTVVSAPGVAAEAVETARAFLMAARDGIPFERMAVLLPNATKQAGAFTEAFARARIPAFFEAGARRPHPAGRAFLALLDCALEGLPATRFAEYLSLGETRPASKQPTTSDETADNPTQGFVAPRRWERLILDSEVIGGIDRWQSRLAHFADRLARDEDAAQHEARKAEIRERRNDLDALRDTALPIVTHLAGFPEHASWGEWSGTLGELARTALLHPEGVLECLAETEPMSDVDGVSLDEVRESLAPRLTEVVTRSTGARYGRVWVGPIENARGLDFEVVSVPGLSEGEFPRVIREDPMLPDRQRRALSPDLPVRSDLRERERLRLRIAIGTGSRRLLLSYSSLDLVEGCVLVPSYYLAEAFRAGLGRIPTLSEIRRAAGSQSQVIPGVRAPRDASLAIDQREYDLAKVAPTATASGRRGTLAGTAGYLLREPALRRALRQEYMRQSHKWQSPDGFLHPDDDAREALEAHRPGNRSFSATGLEAFAECPYKFFLKNVMRLRPPDTVEAIVHLDPLTRGSLLHNVFFHLGTGLRARGMMPLERKQLPDAYKLLEEAFRKVVADFRERVAPSVPRIWEDEMDGLLGDLRGFLERLATSQHSVIANEFTFGMPAEVHSDRQSTDEPAVLPGGLRLHGSIDAVELLPDETLQITDYKTGRVAGGLRGGSLQSVTAGGRLLQPLLYAFAYEAVTGEQVGAGRLYYATVRGAYQEIVVNTTSDLARATLEKFVSQLDRAVTKGRFPAFPNPDSSFSLCDYCDYIPVCGPRPADYHRTKREAALVSVLDEVGGVRSLA